ncbi:MAG: DUF92 domain-containing protein [Gemmatimonadaceae bacterium]|nr:DUF92 domain-containing protein [Gemmatimonadaceae bacterium]
MTLPPLVSAALGPVVAAIVWRAGTLTAGGAVTAALIGSTSALAGLDWMCILLAFFVSSVLLGRVGRERKRQRSAAVIGKAGARDAMQVLANGAVFALGAAAAASGRGTDAIAAIALGAVAAATADTWGTEIGMLAGAPPRSILTGAPLEPGMSGGVTAQGLIATAAGAITLATLAWALGWPGRVVIAAAAGGAAGAMADSVIGATLQQRRRSPGTGRLTERLRDDDGTPTEWAGGVRWLDNDGVNFAATCIGAGIAFELHHLMTRGAA